MTNATANGVQETNKISNWFCTKAGTGLNADRSADIPASAMLVHAHSFLFFFLFIAQVPTS